MYQKEGRWEKKEKIIVDGKARKIKVKISRKDFPTLKLVDEKDIAMDFATKVYEKFNKVVKSIILFGSQVKKNSSSRLRY